MQRCTGASQSSTFSIGRVVATRTEIEAPDVFEKAFGDTVWKRFEALVPRAKTILRPIAQLEKAGPLRTR